MQLWSLLTCDFAPLTASVNVTDHFISHGYGRTNRPHLIKVLHINSKQTAVLTDAGDEVIKSFLWKQRVLQTPKVELQHPGHRVDVVVALLVNQRVITWKTDRTSLTTSKSTTCQSPDPSGDLLTSLEGVLDVVDLHL